MEGFHSLWSKPYMAGRHTEEYWMQDYEVLTMILSALMWRKHNGGIRLCADAEAIAFVEKMGLYHIWNLGIEEITVPEAVPEKVFWAAGKLYSLKKMQMPAVMVDLDLIIWKDIRNIIKDTDICAIHREGIFPDVYPGKEFFHMKQEYRFDPDWSFEVLPVNTCMLSRMKRLRIIMLTVRSHLWRIVWRQRRIFAIWYLRNSGFLRCAQRSRESRYHLFFPVRHRSRTRISSHIYGAIRTF